MLPFIFRAEEEKQNNILEEITDIANGSTILRRTMEEMKSIIQEDSFVIRLKAKVAENGHHKDILEKLNVDNIEVRVDERGHAIGGEYRQEQREYFPSKFGVMNSWYVNRSIPQQELVMQAMYGLGSTRTISKHTGVVVNGKSKEDPVLLYKWHKGNNMTALIPPKEGWEKMYGDSNSETTDDDANNDALPAYVIQYTINSR